MFDNVIRIPADKEDLIQFSKYSYEAERYLYYFNFTKDVKFLNLHREALKKLFKNSHYIMDTYLKNIEHEYNMMDIANSSIKCILEDKDNDK